MFINKNLKKIKSVMKRLRDETNLMRGEGG